MTAGKRSLQRYFNCCTTQKPSIHHKITVPSYSNYHYRNTNLDQKNPPRYTTRHHRNLNPKQHTLDCEFSINHRSQISPFSSIYTPAIPSPPPEKPMAKQVSFISLLSVLIFAGASAGINLQSTYIIHVSPSLRPLTSPSPSHWYASTLRSLAGGPTPQILYTYDRVADGFAAILSAGQATALRRLPQILSVVPDRPRSLHTTHSPSFLNLSPSSGIWPSSSYAKGVVIAVLDTGISPASASFQDASLNFPPSTFHSSCAFPNSSFCTNKLVGAKFFSKGYEASLGHPIDETRESKSPLDTEGHGSHTSSTAAGASVAGASFLGYADGIARGIATNAHIAAYKICWAPGCFDSDILAAMDEAVADGANVISLSVGSSGYSPAYYRDSIAVGAFGAARHGVVVSCSAGNSGPFSYTAVNIAPWIITVGASTLDRDFPADVVLGDGSRHNGVSLYSGDDNGTIVDLPLVYAGDCGSRLCISRFLDPAKVAGKIVLCDRGSNARVEKGAAVRLAGGSGMILANSDDFGDDLTADSHIVPATMVGASSGNRIRAYISTAASPTASINFRGTVVSGDILAPKVAAFSSRGPNYRTAEILKPDVIAPGVNILAAWTDAASPTDLDIDPRRVKYNIISGTSMACPHVSGVAALLRGAHPDWSPAAIKSALITTASNLDNSGKIIKDLSTGDQSTPFVRGAGHVDPNKALDPGLVYDAGFHDYVRFLCSIGYNSKQIAVFTRDAAAVDCSSAALSSPGDLNYPSFSVVFSTGGDSVTYTRTVKNVASVYSDAVKYTAVVGSPPGVTVTVKPSELVFTPANRSLSYEIEFASIAGSEAAGSHQFGWINWTDGVHEVRSPIAITWVRSWVSSM